MPRVMGELETHRDGADIQITELSNRIRDRDCWNANRFG